MTTPNIPEFLLLCMEEEFTPAFTTALSTHWPDFDPSSPKIKFTHSNERLNSLPAEAKYDLIVSPANSYGRLDGAFDHAISLAFSPRKDYHALTRAAQACLYEKYRGFAPPGTCTLVPFPEALKDNDRGCKWVAICPTMREPEVVMWNREVVYECVWSLLCEVERWNRTAGPGEKIERVLMTPLAAGIGRVTKERWAGQTVLAMKHFVDALERPERWSALNWEDIEKDSDEVATTWKGNK